MGGVSGDFDVPALLAAVDHQRVAKDMSWAQLTREIAWMSQSTIKRMRERGGTAGCHHVLPLIQWVGRTPESFTIGGDDGEGWLLPDPGTKGWRWYWNMPELAAALERQRTERDLTTPELAAQLSCGVHDIKHLHQTRYGTTISIAMRVARWLDRPAASFMWEHDGRGLPWSGRRV